MLAGVIFDLDGVIADTHTIHRHAWRQLLVEMGRQISEEELDFVLEGRKRDELFRQSAEQLRSVPGVVDFLRQLDDAGVPRAVATCASKRRTYQVLECLG